MGNNGQMKLERALAIVHTVVSEAPGPVSVFVADDHGELVAAATMDGAAPDTRLNAQRKAYTTARSDARTTRELAEKAQEDAVERASFDPFFTFFLGGGCPTATCGWAESASAAVRATWTSSSPCERSNDLPWPAQTGKPSLPYTPRPSSSACTASIPIQSQAGLSWS